MDKMIPGANVRALAGPWHGEIVVTHTRNGGVAVRQASGGTGDQVPRPAGRDEQVTNPNHQLQKRINGGGVFVANANMSNRGA